MLPGGPARAHWHVSGAGSAGGAGEAEGASGAARRLRVGVRLGVRLG